MSRFLLDTDPLTLFENGNPNILREMARQPASGVFVTPITIEESLRGRLALVASARDGPTRIRRYAQLVESVFQLHQFDVASFDQPCEDQFQQLRKLRLRIGTPDLKIGAAALVHKLTLLTRNRRDFARIPGIVLDDWSV